MKTWQTSQLGRTLSSFIFVLFCCHHACRKYLGHIPSLSTDSVTGLLLLWDLTDPNNLFGWSATQFQVQSHWILCLKSAAHMVHSRHSKFIKLPSINILKMKTQMHTVKPDALLLAPFTLFNINEMQTSVWACIQHKWWNSTDVGKSRQLEENGRKIELSKLF